MRVSMLALIAMGVAGGGVNIGDPPPSAAPVLTPAFFTTQTATEHDVQQPAQDFDLKNVSLDGHCTTAPTFNIDVVEDQHFKDNTDVVITVFGDHGDTAELPVTYNVYVCGDAGFTPLSMVENHGVSLRTGAIGTQFVLKGTTSTSRRYAWIRVDAVPQNGYVRSLWRRIMFEESGFAAGSNNIAYVSCAPGATGGTGTIASPFATFLQATNFVSDGGIIYIDALYPTTFDDEAGGAGRGIYDPVEVRPYNGAVASFTRTTQAIKSGVTTSTSSNYNYATNLNLNKVHFYNVIYDTYRLGYLNPTNFSKGINYAWIAGQMAHDQMAADGAYHITAPFQNDSIMLLTANLNTQVKRSLSIVKCTGIMPSTGGLTLGVGNNLSIPWDISYGPTEQDYSAGFSQHNVSQNRAFIQAAHARHAAPLKLSAAPYRDSYNEIAALPVGLEAFPGKATVAVASTGIATITIYDASGNTQALALGTGTYIIFDNGPLAGLSLTIPANSTTLGYQSYTGNIMRIQTSGVNAVAAGSFYTFKIRSFSARTAGDSPPSEFSQVRILSGAAKMAYDPNDSGLRANYGILSGDDTTLRKCSPAGAVAKRVGIR